MVRGVQRRSSEFGGSGKCWGRPRLTGVWAPAPMVGILPQVTTRQAWKIHTNIVLYIGAGGQAVRDKGERRQRLGMSLTAKSGNAWLAAEH